MATMSLKVGATDYTDRTIWKSCKLSVRDSIGTAATLVLDATEGSMPDALDRFTLTLPTGEKFVLIPDGEPTVTTYAVSDVEGDIVVVYEYGCIDPLTALDRLPLPAGQVYIDETTGGILSDLISQLDPTLTTTGIVDGNVVPVLDCDELSKFSDALGADGVLEGDYVLVMDPASTGGLGVIGKYKEDFGASGIRVDKDEADNFTPPKEPLSPDNEIVNYQKVKGIASGGPDHSVCEFRELDILNSTFKLAAKPFGIEDAQVFSHQFEAGTINAATNSDESFPSVVPQRYPVSIEVADLEHDGTTTAEVCAFLGNADAVLLSTLITTTQIGARVDGTAHYVTVPLAPAGVPADDDHQYYYDWIAQYKTDDSLEVTLYEYYLDALAGETVLATVDSHLDKVLTLTLESGVAIEDLPGEIRFFDAGDPDAVIGFATILSRSGSTITIDDYPTDVPDDVLTTEIAFGDAAVTTQTTAVIYSGAAPASSYGRPKPQISGTAHARAWRASHGPAVSAELLSDAAYGVVGRKLRVDVGEASRSTDLLIAASGETATAQWTKTFEVTRGPVKILLNYDAAKQAEYIAQSAPSQAIYEVRKGDTIESDLAYTVADCQLIADAVVAERAFPSPQGTITRESYLVADFPTPPMTAWVDLPAEYRMDAEAVPISEVSVDFSGYDAIAAEGLVTYQITLGSLNSIEVAERALYLRKLQRTGGFYLGDSGGLRITGATWDDVDTVTLTIPGASSVVLAGKAAALTFDPRDYATGSLRGQPVSLMGLVNGVTTLHVEVIYPPDPVDADSGKYKYNAKANEVVYRWARPAGAESFYIDRLLERELEADPEEYTRLDQVFSTRYPMPYEPLSKKLRVTSTGLADKVSAPTILVCTLPVLDAPDIFDVVRVSAQDRITFRIGAAPKRAEHVRIFTKRVTDASTPGAAEVDWLAFFAEDDAEVDVTDYPAVASVTRRKVDFEDTRLDDVVWCTAAWVDRFGDLMHLYEPYDATRPPLEVGSIDASTFFRSPVPATPATNQAAGGTIEDDNDETTQVDFSGKFRVNLGRGVEVVRLWLEECAPTSDHTVGAWDTDKPAHGPFAGHVTDVDADNGYIDIDVSQEFRWSKKKRRTYRPSKIVFVGARVRERIGPSTEEEGVRERKFLIGLDTYPTVPATIPYTADGYFDKTLFEFKPGIAGLANNFTAITGFAVNERADGFKLKWDPINLSSVRRYVVLISTADFGTKGPGTDTSIDAALDALVGEGSITAYLPDNVTETATVYAIDSGLTPSHRFYNGEVIGGLTLAEGTTYYVSVIAQSKNGRWCSEFVDPLNSETGSAGGEDLPIETGANGPNYPSGPGASWATTGTNAAVHRNHIIGDIAKLQAEVAFQLIMDSADQINTFDTPNTGFGPVRDAVIILQKRNAGNSANEGDPIRIKVGIDGTKGSSALPFYAGARLEAGAIYDWPETIFYNNGNELKLSTTPANTRFQAGRGSHSFDATVLSAAGLTITDGTNNRTAEVQVAFTQPATPVLLKRAVFEITYNLSAGGAATWRKVKSENLLDDANYFNMAGGGAKVLKTHIPHRKNQFDMGIRCIIVPVLSDYGSTGIGSPNKVITSATLSAAQDEDLNTVAPPGGSITTPTIKWTRKGLRCRVGPLSAATDGFRGITRYGWVLRANDDSTYVTIEGASSATRAGAEFFTTDNHVLLNFKRRDLASALRTTGLKVYVRVSAPLAGVETASTGGVTVGAGGDAQVGYSAASSGTGALETDSFNDEDGITVRRQHHSNQNLIEGGAGQNGRGPAQYNAGSGTDLQMGRNWRVGSAANGLSTAHADNIANNFAAGPIGPNFLTTTTKYGISWDRTNHRVAFTTTGSRLAAVVGRNVHGGRWMSFSALIGAATAVTLTNFKVYYVSIRNATNAGSPSDTGGVVEVIQIGSGGAASSINAGALVVPAVSSSVGYKFIGGTFRLPAGFAPSSATNFTSCIVFEPTWSGANTIYLDDMALYHGRSVRGFQPGSIEKDLDIVVVPAINGPHNATYDDTGILNEGLADFTIGEFAI